MFVSGIDIENQTRFIEIYSINSLMNQIQESLVQNQIQESGLNDDEKKNDRWLSERLQFFFLQWIVYIVEIPALWRLNK